MSVRYIIFAAMFAVGFILLQNWTKFSEEKYNQSQLAASQAPLSQNTNSTVSASDVPNVQLANNASQTTAANEDIPQLNKAPVAAAAQLTASQQQALNKNLITIDTDVLRLKLDPRGGDIVYAELKKQKKSLDSKENFVILEDNALRTYVLQSGLIGQNGTDTSQGAATYSSAQKQYTMAQGEKQLVVDLTLQQSTGSVITKRFIFNANDYLVKLEYLVDNKSASMWSGAFYGQIKRDESVDPSSENGGGGLGLQPFLGFAASTEDERFEKFSFKDISKKTFSQKQPDAWLALIQHYFLSAWIPNKDKDYDYSILKTSQGFYLGRVIGPVMNVAAGQQGTISSQFYVGPKDQYRLKEVSPGLDLSVDYSFLWWIAQPLYSLLTFFSTGRLHMFGFDKQLFPGFGNWGISIILLTLLVKILFFKLNQKAYRSMGKMKKFAPKMKSIKDRFPDDRQKQSQAMMELYKKEKINPMGGCLPMLVQMPVFLALYWVLMESVELRHAPFMLWIQDLSAKDPYFILPIIMGASMWFQQKLNPKPADPMQAKVMQWLPVIFSVFFLFFPAGLVLYWVVNNILSISQQWIITRQIEREDQAANPTSA